MKIFNQVIEFIKERPYEAMLVVIVAFVFLIVFILPITALMLLASFAYAKAFDSFVIGLVIAVPVIFVGVMSGALIALINGRYLFADYIKRKIKRSNDPKVKHFKIVDGMFKERGILFVGLIRLMMLPFGVMCYSLGVTSVSVIDYMLGSSFYIIKILIFSILGCSIYSATQSPDEDKRTHIAIIIFEIILTLTITIVITVWAKREFDRRYEESVEREKREEEAATSSMMNTEEIKEGKMEGRAGDDEESPLMGESRTDTYE